MPNAIHDVFASISKEVGFNVTQSINYTFFLLSNLKHLNKGLTSSSSRIRFTPLALLIKPM
jgi:hypothetical protein